MTVSYLGDVVQLLLDHEGGVNVQGADPWMPLQFALLTDILKLRNCLLIERGTVVDVAVQVAVTWFLGCDLV